MNGKFEINFWIIDLLPFKLLHIYINANLIDVVDIWSFELCIMCKIFNKSGNCGYLVFQKMFKYF